MSPRKAALTPAKKTLLGWIKEREPWLSQAHTHIWNLHETAWREYRSAAYYVQLLREHGFEVEEVPAAGERDHGTAALAQAHRADLLRHVPGADLAPVGRAAEHPAVEAIDPVEALLLHVPQGAFTEGRLDVDQDLDAHQLIPPRGVVERWDRMSRSFM